MMTTVTKMMMIMLTTTVMVTKGSHYLTSMSLLSNAQGIQQVAHQNNNKP